MRDIAEQLNLSQTTVSHVLTGKHERYRISSRTVDRVRKAAEELGYRSNALARAFREKRAGAVAFAVADLPNPFWTGVAAGAEEESEKAGYLFVVTNIRGRAERERRLVRMLQERRIDGLIAAPELEDPVLLELVREGRPFVQLDRSIRGVDLPCVRTDHVAGSVMAIDHLVSRGRREIAHVGGPLAIETYELRAAGYRKGLAKHGLKPAAVVHVPLDPEAARKAVLELLRGKRRPDALYTANIWITIGALRAVRDAGVAIPQDLEIVGFDDLADADLFRDPVSTIRQDVEAVGREAFRVLLKLMKGRKVPREVLLRPRLVAR